MDDRGYLLLVEDEPIVQANNKMILERRGYSIRQAYSLAEARAIAAEEPPRAIVLDIQLPDGSGIDFLRELRQTSNVPVLVLTAMGTAEDIIKGLEAGGDDYLPKPYDLSVFLSRVEAVVRRGSLLPDKLALGPIKIDTASNMAYLKGVDMMLQPKELSLLQYFIQRPDKVMSAELLYEKVWGQPMNRDDNAVKTAASRLRAKLEGSGYTISTERGKGYCFEKKSNIPT